MGENKSYKEMSTHEKLEHAFLIVGITASILGIIVSSFTVKKLLAKK